MLYFPMHQKVWTGLSQSFSTTLFSMQITPFVNYLKTIYKHNCHFKATRRWVRTTTDSTKMFKY